MTVIQIYNIKFLLKNSDKYGVTADGKMFNLRTGREMKRCLIGTTQGYCIDGRFKSLKNIRKELYKPDKLPF